jgi:hypothetical protein
LIVERADLQRLLQAKLDMIVDDVLVVSEEFGAFADARRRIDLLGVDRAGHVVVVELKREPGTRPETASDRRSRCRGPLSFPSCRPLHGGWTPWHHV